MSVRPATPDDAGDLARLHALGFEDGWSVADFVTWLARPQAMAMIAERDREPFAFGLALAAGEDADLLTITTDPSRRAQGFGREIFRALDAEAQRRRLNRWILEVARNNLAAIGLYKSEGFVEIGLRKDYYKTREGRVDAFVMSRPVGSGGGQDEG